MSAAMERQPSIRPARPSRDLPPLPAGFVPPQAEGTTASTPGHGSDIFHTPLSRSPELVESPTSEEPPSLSDKQLEVKGVSQDFTTLNSIRAHYLKKELIQLQFHHELTLLTNVPTNNISTFSYLGPPFTPPPKDGPRLDLPFLRFMFRKFVLSFPFLAAAPKDFFPDTLQPFMASMLSRNLSASSPLDDDPENTEEAARYKLLVKLERNFAMLLTSGTKLAEEEDVVRLTQKDLDRLEYLARKRAARESKLKDLFEINVVCVRTVVEKGRVRSKAHEEFIIRTRRRGHPDVFVSRRYGDFKTLADELHKHHPSEIIPPPPAKDRSYVNVTLSGPSSAIATPPSPHYSSPSREDGPTSPTSGLPYAPRHGRPRTGHMPGMYEPSINGSVDSLASSQLSGSPTSPTYASFGFGSSSTTHARSQASRLAREKNRLTLRSYINALLSSSVLASSPVLKSFLLSGPTKLSPEELEDAQRREEADRMRDDGRKRFAEEIRDRVDGLRDAVRSVKGELLGKDGLTHVFATIKHTQDVRALPANYRAVIEWARISLASTVFHHFVAADNASESFAGLKRIHGMMPYFMLKAALKISNPVGMIRGVLDLFLAQPFGGKSLLQRMFTGSLMEEVKALEEDIAAVKDKVDDPLMCEKVRVFVYAPREIQAVYKADAAEENINILTAVLRSGEQPVLQRHQLQRVMRASKAHKEYVEHSKHLADSDDDEGPEDEDAWLYEDLYLLAKLYTRLKDREQLIALIFEGTTADLLKNIITIFYAPLAQVYRAASIADSLGDLQTFINDLIRTVEQTEELSQEDPSKTVQIFIDLIQRHEQAFYTFVHKVHSKGEGLFDNLMRWIEQFLTLMRDGVGERISLEFLLPHTGPDRENIMKEVDEIARYHYMTKVAYEAKVRRRFGKTQGDGGAEAEDEAAELVNGVVRDLSFGELISGDAQDLAAQASDDEGSSEEETDSGSEESGSSEEDSSEEESENGSTTDGHRTRQNTPTARSPVARSRTIGHSPAESRSNSTRLRQSLDLPRSRPPVPGTPLSSRPPPPPMRSSRSMYMPLAPLSRDKSLPPPPLGRAQADEGNRQQVNSPPTPSKKKKHAGPKPPELTHIPELLPLFVEMMRPLLQTGRM